MVRNKIWTIFIKITYYKDFNNARNPQNLMFRLPYVDANMYRLNIGGTNWSLQYNGTLIF